MADDRGDLYTALRGTLGPQGEPKVRTPMPNPKKFLRRGQGTDNRMKATMATKAASKDFFRDSGQAPLKEKNANMFTSNKSLIDSAQHRIRQSLNVANERRSIEAIEKEEFEALEHKIHAELGLYSEEETPPPPEETSEIVRPDNVNMHNVSSRINRENVRRKVPVPERKKSSKLFADEFNMTGKVFVQGTGSADDIIFEKDGENHSFGAWGRILGEDNETSRRNETAVEDKIVMSGILKRGQDLSVRPVTAGGVRPLLKESGVNSSDKTYPHVSAQVLASKAAELEQEITKFKEENEKLVKQRRKLEDLRSRTMSEHQAWERKKEIEIAELENKKQGLASSLARERRTLQREKNQMLKLPTRKERDEIEDLRKEFESYREEAQRREKRLRFEVERLRKANDALTAKNKDLAVEVRAFENEAIQNEWSQDAQTTTRAKVRIVKNVDGASSHVGDRLHRPESGCTDMAYAMGGADNILSAAKETMRECLGGAEEHSGSDVRYGNFAIEESEHTHQDERELLKNTMQSRPPHTLHEEEWNKIDELAYNDDQFEEILHVGGKVERRYKSGRKIVFFTNGTRKESFPSGCYSAVYFHNGDIKKSFSSPEYTPRLEYFYAEVSTWHTTYPEGLEVYEFPNNQVERHFSDGSKEIVHPDGTMRHILSDGREVCDN